MENQNDKYYDAEDEELMEDFNVCGVQVTMEQTDEDDLAEFEVDDSLVFLEGPVGHFSVNGEEYLAREGVWCEKNDDGEFEPDWSLTWVYTDKEHPEDYLYYEQDPMHTALYNFLRATT